jgi:hypothetical protein
MSFYFICLFGMRSLFALVLGEGSPTLQQMNGMGMDAAGAGPVPEPGKIFDAEREALQVIFSSISVVKPEPSAASRSSLCHKNVLLPHARR